MAKLTLVLAPLKRELHLLLEGVAREGHSFEKKDHRFYIPSLNCVCMTSGLGAQATLEKRKDLSTLKHKISQVFAVGGAGALTSNLKVGDVLSVYSIVHPHNVFAPVVLENVVEPDLEVLKWAFQWRPGVIVVVDAVVSECGQVEALKVCGGEAVTFESEATYQLAKQLDCSYHELRGITDNCQGDVEQLFLKNLKEAMDHCAKAFVHLLEEG